MAGELWFITGLMTQFCGWLLITKGLVIVAEVIKDVWICVVLIP